MLDLAFSILFSSLIFVIFKLFDRFKIQTLYAIITNYFVACTVGLLFYKNPINLSEIPQKNWFLGTLALGCLFILVFNLMAKTAQTSGVSVASVATKMSLVIPVLFGVFLYKEDLSPLKIIGIMLALAAVYFASIKSDSLVIKKASLVLPLLVFLGSGAIDASIKFMENGFVPTQEFPLFSAMIFLSAGVLGLLFMVIKAKRNPVKINFKNVIGGVALGIPNYFSIYYLLKALQHPTLESSSVFTINNVAIVMLSTLLGILLFKEQLSVKNWIGVGLAVISILLVALF